MYFFKFQNKFPELKSYKLNSLCEHFNIELKNHHRAYDDAKATFELFKILNENKKYLISVTGPTAVGKTNLSIEIAKKFNSEIISFDSRQFYKEMTIGTCS